MALPGWGLGMLSSALSFLHLRLSLFAIEARQARVSLLSGFFLLGGGLVFLCLGWIGFWIGFVPWFAGMTGAPWPAVGMGVALFHFLVGGGALFLGRKRFSSRLFRDSLDELQRDREWLEGLRDTNPS